MVGLGKGASYRHRMVKPPGPQVVAGRLREAIDLPVRPTGARSAQPDALKQSHFF